MFVSTRPTRLPAGSPHTRQDGVVLMVALIILVAMTLAGVALIRSVDTANVIAGNLAFHQSATNAGERSAEQAVNWLAKYSKPGDITLQNAVKEQGYLASCCEDPPKDPAADSSWDDFWEHSKLADNTLLKDWSVPAPPLGARCPVDANADLACDTVRYVVQRLCPKTGLPPNPDNGTNPCSQRPIDPNAGGGSLSAGVVPGAPPRKQVYYRITTRIEGPRRTVSYIQTIVAI